MAQTKSRDLADLTGTGQNAGVNTSDLESATIWVKGTFVGTVQPQESPNNVDWYDVGSPVTAPGRQAMSADALYGRLNCTAYTSGTIEGLITGVDNDLKG
jgi:hypothetical protein